MDNLITYVARLGAFACESKRRISDKEYRLHWQTSLLEAKICTLALLQTPKF